MVNLRQAKENANRIEIMAITISQAGWQCLLGTGIRNGVKKWSWTSYSKEKVGQAKKCASCALCAVCLRMEAPSSSASLLLEGGKKTNKADRQWFPLEVSLSLSHGLPCSLVAEKTLCHDFAINGARKQRKKGGQGPLWGRGRAGNSLIE